MFSMLLTLSFSFSFFFQLHGCNYIISGYLAILTLVRSEWFLIFICSLMNFKDTEGKLKTDAFVGCRKERKICSTSKKASPSNIFILFWDKLTAICFDISVVSPSGLFSLCQCQSQRECKQVAPKCCTATKKIHRKYEENNSLIYKKKKLRYQALFNSKGKA